MADVAIKDKTVAVLALDDKVLFSDTSDSGATKNAIGVPVLTTAQTAAGGINVPALTSGNVLLDASGATVLTKSGTTTITFPGLTYSPFFVATGYVVTPTVYIESNTGFLAFGSSQDARMFYGGSNQIEQRNGTASQTKRVFGTWTDASNGRWLNITMSTAGVAAITPTGNGTGASGNVLHISGLPTSNPGPGILWNDAGTVKVGT